MKYSAIGLMSGTSLDGTDITYCIFEHKNSKWNFKILKAQTIPYPLKWEEKLREVPGMCGQDLIKAHVDYGHYLGKITKYFIEENGLKVPDLIASHGHTVYHQPEEGFTFQMGDGSAISAQTKCTVVCDFRSLSVACGGQGAPLVPTGDELLFGNFDFCLNIGGFANISYKEKRKRVAFDICPANYVINYLTKNRQREARKILNYNDSNTKILFDPEGRIASMGKNSTSLISKLNKLVYYNEKPPKSLGAEWVEKNIFPIINEYNNLPLQDLLKSYYEHITFQVNQAVKNKNGKTMLITGGGAYNKFLIDLLIKNLNIDIHIPDKLIIEYKEALVFALLGVLRINKLPNIFSNASGGQKNNISGAVFEGK